MHTAARPPIFFWRDISCYKPFSLASFSLRYHHISCFGYTEQPHKSSWVLLTSTLRLLVGMLIFQ